ncbi:DUF6232 family protein [Streptomyces sp. NPDC035033]|uniref:DUF6232 family protein n=1 Tax=Streptomyces sp. NPDC035033 TaxID=3155368 RepID=UPI0033D5A626
MPPGNPGPVRLQGSSPLQLRVDRRVLWVEGAAYPLENIVRVYTFILRPRRAEAVLRLGKRLAQILVGYLLVTLVGDLADGFGASSGPYGPEPSESGMLGLALGLAVLVLFGFLLYTLGEVLPVIIARSHLALAVETNGRSTALVTGPPDVLHRLVGEIAQAIENTDAHLEERVASLSIGNPANYYFGDIVNMYGGTGNKGILR